MVNSSSFYDGLDDLTLVSDQAISENNKISAETLRKLYRVSTSSKMGDPSRKERVESQFIVVFMLCRDEVPDIAMINNGSDALFRIGNQAVTYWEHFFQFTTLDTAAVNAGE